MTEWRLLLQELSPRSSPGTVSCMPKNKESFRYDACVSFLEIPSKHRPDSNDICHQSAFCTAVPAIMMAMKIGPALCGVCFLPDPAIRIDCPLLPCLAPAIHISIQVCCGMAIKKRHVQPPSNPSNNAGEIVNLLLTNICETSQTYVPCTLALLMGCNNFPTH